jgi:rod shape-determining protein MreD
MSALNVVTPRATRRGISSSFPVRVAVVVVVILVAAALQLSLAAPLSEVGLMPNLLLLVVVASALSCGRDFAAAMGFGLGLALDLGPASDHLAGRWALALVVVGFVVGTAAHARPVRHTGGQPRARMGRPTLMVVAAAASFVGTSVFALTGLVLRDPATSLPEVLRVIASASLSDALFGLVLLPLLISVFDRLTPTQET